MIHVGVVGGVGIANGLAWLGNILVGSGSWSKLRRRSQNVRTVAAWLRFDWRSAREGRCALTEDRLVGLLTNVVLFVLHTGLVLIYGEASFRNGVRHLLSGACRRWKQGAWIVGRDQVQLVQVRQRPVMESEGSEWGVFGVDEVEVEVCDILRVVDKSTAGCTVPLWLVKGSSPAFCWWRENLRDAVSVHVAVLVQPRSPPLPPLSPI